MLSATYDNFVVQKPTWLSQDRMAVGLNCIADSMYHGVGHRWTAPGMDVIWSFYEDLFLHLVRASMVWIYPWV